MILRDKLIAFAAETASYLRTSPNTLFEENPEFIENILNEDWDTDVENILGQMEKIFDYIKTHKSIQGLGIGAFCFQWNDFDHDSFDIWLSTSNKYESWMDNDLEDYGTIDFEPILSRIFPGLEDRESELHDDLNYVNDLMASLMETAIFKAISKGMFDKCPRLDPYLVTLRMWHDVEINLLYHSEGKQIEDKYLTIENSRLPEISEVIEQKSLNTDSIKIGKEFFKLNQKRIRAYDKGIKNIPDEIYQIVNLEEIVFSRNNIKKIPGQVWKLEKLERLYLDNNKIEEIPAGVGVLKKLNMLTLENNKIKYLPGDLVELENLESLYLGYNELEKVPANMNKLGNLKMIELHNNKLNEIPEMPELLEWLQLGSNKFSDLPQSLKSLKNLKNLMIQDNNFSKIPEVIFELENIEDISFGDNPIREIPDKLFELPNLKKVNFRPNLLTVEERAVLLDKYGDRLFLGYDSDKNSFMTE